MSHFLYDTKELLCYLKKKQTNKQTHSQTNKHKMGMSLKWKNAKFTKIKQKKCILSKQHCLLKSALFRFVQNCPRLARLIIYQRKQLFQQNVNEYNLRLDDKRKCDQGYLLTLPQANTKNQLLVTFFILGTVGEMLRTNLPIDM